LNIAFKVEAFQLAHPKWPSFLNTSYDLGAWNASIYILQDLERMINNMGQTFGEEKNFRMDIQH